MGDAAKLCRVTLPFLDPETWAQDMANLTVLVPAYNDCAARHDSALRQWEEMRARLNAECGRPS